MREKSEILKNKAYPAARNRDVDAPGGIEQNPVTDGYVARVRLGETGNAFQYGALPCPGRPEQDVDARGSTELRIQREAAASGETLLEAHREPEAASSG
jgi:hypothetical protein